MELLASITLADISDGKDGEQITWLEVTTRPQNPSKNQAYYDQYDKVSYIYNGKEWVILAKDGSDASELLSQKYLLKSNTERITRTMQYDDYTREYIYYYSPEIFELYLLNTVDKAPLKKDEYYLSCFISSSDGKTKHIIETENSKESDTELKESDKVTRENEEKNSLEKIGFTVDVTSSNSISSLFNDEFSKYFKKYFYWDNDKFYIDFQLLHQDYLFLSKTNDFIILSEEQQAISKFVQMLNGENLNLLVNAYLIEDGKPTEINLYSFSINWSTTEDLAKLSINANSIVQSIDKANLKFSADGLTLTNGGLQIFTETFFPSHNRKKVFGFVSDELGNSFLEITGKIIADSGTFGGNLSGATGTFAGALEAATGTFSGELQAASGTFSGELRAAEGTFLGELQILKRDDENNVTDSIYIGTNKQANKPFGIYQESFTEEGNVISNFSVDERGHVIANSIELKNGTIGDIIFNDSQIHTPYWDLNKDGANFKNVNIQGKLTATVFESNKIQASGSSFIFKEAINFEPLTLPEVDAIKINLFLDNETRENENENSENVTEDNELIYLEPMNFILNILNGTERCLDFQENKIYLFSGDNGSFFAFYNSKEDVFISQSSIPAGTYDVMLDYGEISTEKDVLLLPKDWIISINSQYSSQDDKAGLKPNSITFSELEYDFKNEVTAVPKIILGQLPPYIFDNKNYTNSYGLYSESAFLTGTLTTKFDSNGNSKYAGVNTLSGAEFKQLPEEKNEITDVLGFDKSKIIFWAGSTGTTDNEIANAPFQVTEAGTLYAQRALFANSVLSQADIQASTIHAATIYGLKDERALTIKDSDNMVAFVRINPDQSENVIFDLNSENLSLSVPLTFIGNSDLNIKNAIISTPKIYVREDILNAKNSLSLQPDSLRFSNYDEYLDLNANKYELDLIYKELGPGKNKNPVLEFIHRIQEPQDKEQVLAYFGEEDSGVFSDFVCNNGLKFAVNQTSYTAQFKPVFIMDEQKKSQEVIGIDLYITDINLSKGE